MIRLTPEAVRDMVSRLKTMTLDPEMAHSHEDKIRVGVLRAIAEGSPEPAKLAEEALKTVNINFPRWGG